MGAYLSQPKTDKLSTDELNEFLTVGASSMQGWRNSQEDAHNAILDFDKNTAFFAVYDGHGGAEVSTYCADKLPNFLKELEAYKNGNFEQALKDAFLGFDKTLLEPAVIEILKVLAGEKNNVDGDDSDALDDDEDENLAELHEEGSLPLDEVMEKYKGHPSMPSLKKLKDSGSSSGPKPQSPYLRGRRAAAVIADAANRAELDPDSKPEGSSTSKAALAALQNEEGPSSSKGASSSSAANKMETEEDSTVSSSSSSASKTNNTSNATANSTEAEPSSSKESNGKATELPDSSAVKENEQNGSVSSTETKSAAAKANEVVVSASSDSTSSSNTTSKQNGNVESSTKSLSPSKNEANNASDISSTSKEQKEKKNSAFSEDSNDDDEMDANESNARQALEYSSEEEEDLGDEDTTEDEDADYDDDDEVDDEDDDAEDEEDEESFLANEQFCANMIEEPGKDSGCTAVVGLLHGRDLYVANAGDSRCVVCRNGKAIEMSLDHKPEDDEESARIVKAGGRVTLDGRVNGGLNLSRALGDHAYKMNADLPAEEQMISALPDIKKLIISPEDEFMVLACDGIWNFMTSEEVVNFVRLRLKNENVKMSEICEELFDACLAPDTLGDGTGCDNMTAVIVRFKPQILDLPTKIDPKETEDVLSLARQNEVESTSPEQKAQKRCASPTSDDSNEAENKTKRLKTENNKEEGNNATQTSSSITTTTTSSKTGDAEESNSTTNESSNKNEDASSSNVVSST